MIQIGIDASNTLKKTLSTKFARFLLDISTIPILGVKKEEYGEWCIRIEENPTIEIEKVLSRGLKQLWTLLMPIKEEFNQYKKEHLKKDEYFYFASEGIFYSKVEHHIKRFPLATENSSGEIVHYILSLDTFDFLKKCKKYNFNIPKILNDKNIKKREKAFLISFYTSIVELTDLMEDKQLFVSVDEYFDEILSPANKEIIKNNALLN